MPRMLARELRVSWMVGRSGDDLDRLFAGDGSEVAIVECGDPSSMAFGAGNHGGVRISEWHILIADDEFLNSGEITVSAIKSEGTSLDVSQEDGNIFWRNPVFDKIIDFRQNPDWYHARSPLRLQEVDQLFVPGRPAVE